MRSRFAFLLLIFALLLGNSGAPALAYIHDAEPMHALELLDSHFNVEETQGKAGDADANSKTAVHHHHGISDVTLRAPELGTPVRLKRTALAPAPASALASIDAAPLTEPPSA